ncbi:MAG: hypothetical protein ACLFPF_10875 [Halanaerobiales bacterium]
MPNHNRRFDITAEMVAELYEKHKNKSIVADILDCSTTLVTYRLREAGVKTVDNHDRHRRKIKRLRKKQKEKKLFKEKKEQAHYICTELADSLAELILEVKGQMNKGGYKKNYDGGKWGN